ncbi:MAG: hypothetical protein Q9187_009507 [Circinaria calcarea]
MTKLPADETNSTPRARILINMIDTTSGERKDRPASDQLPTIPQGTDTSHAFTLRKNVYENDSNDGEIEIHSQGLWNLLKEHLSHHPNHIFPASPITLYSPYEALIFEWERLEQATKEKPRDEIDKQARSDLELLLGTIASGSGDLKLDKYFKTRESNKEQKSITFETLWTIFPPGELIYGKPFQGDDQVFIVQDILRPWPNNSLRLLCWTYDWNGEKFKRLSLSLIIDRFDGHKPIKSLPYYPLELNECHEAIKKCLIDRGRSFRDFCTAKQGARMFEYSGDIIFDKKGFSGVHINDDNDDAIPPSNFDSEMELLNRLRMSHTASGSAATKSSNVSCIMHYIWLI